jgi:hypothetical protein
MPVLALPLPSVLMVWSEHWQALETRLQAIEDELRSNGARARRATEFDPWDLEVLGGPLGSARLRATVEEHGNGKQLVRFFIQPAISRWRVVEAGILSTLAAGAFHGGAWAAGIVLGIIAAGLCFRAIFECADAAGDLRRGAHLASEYLERMQPAREVTEAWWKDQAIWSNHQTAEHVLHR